MYALNNGSVVLPGCHAACGQQLVLLCAGVVNDDVQAVVQGQVVSTGNVVDAAHLLVKTKHSPVADSAPLSEQLAQI